MLVLADAKKGVPDVELHVKKAVPWAALAHVQDIAAERTNINVAFYIYNRALPLITFQKSIHEKQRLENKKRVLQASREESFANIRFHLLYQTAKHFLCRKVYI